MSDTEIVGSTLAGDELQLTNERLQSLNKNIQDFAQTLSNRVTNTTKVVEVKSIVYDGIRKLIVHTSDSCFVYDSDAGLCRACNASEE